MYEMRAGAAPIEIRTHEDWLYYVKPSRERRILRELEQRRKML